MTEHPQEAGGPGPQRRPDGGRRASFPGGTEYPGGEAAPGGYHAPDASALYGPPPTAPMEPDPMGPAPGTERPAPAGEPYRRHTPARRKPIPDMRGGGHGRLAAAAVLFVMVTGGAADFVPPWTRATAHLLFWAGVAVAALIALARERRNGWDPSPRWVWPAAALGGTLLAELLIALFGSPAIIVGSVVVAGLFLFVVALFG